MKILENPNPVPSYVCKCVKCSCKFEFTDRDIIVKNWNDANGRLGGTHYWSVTKYVNCPNCGEQVIISRKSGYGSSMIGDQHITEDYHIEFEQ